MTSLSLFTVDSNYVNYLCSFSPHLFREKEGARKRKYVGIVLKMNGFSYFAPLTSFKRKHLRLSNSIDFIKIRYISAINLNKMFPVPEGCFSEVVIKKERNSSYRQLLYREQRFIQKNEQLVWENTRSLYERVVMNPNSKLARRSNDFRLLETACREYKDYT